MMTLLSYFCLTMGLIFWIWGTLPLIGHRSLLFKIHTLSVSDTLGSMSIIVGLLLRIPREWPLLILALLSLALWNTVLGYVMAYCSSPDDHNDGSETRSNQHPDHNPSFPDHYLSTEGVGDSGGHYG